jgi:hypothetical protein
MTLKFTSFQLNMLHVVCHLLIKSLNLHLRASVKVLIKFIISYKLKLLRQLII